MSPDPTRERTDVAHPRSATWRVIRRWQGVALAAVTLVATLWLAATGQLVLYIHPRYVVFTVAMALIGLTLVIASVVRRPADGHHHDHIDEGGFPERRSRLGGAASVVATVLTAAVGLSLIVLPPATLSAATAAQRDINSTVASADTASVDEAASASDATFEAFTVQDWSGFLRQTSDLAFFADKPVHVVGFITEDPEDPANVFYVSRFAITCCAVDAQPFGVPVHLDDWKSSYAVDQWVDIRGGFATNPSADSTEPIALVPDSITPIEQPSDPYLY